MKRTHEEWYFSDHPLGAREWPVTTAELSRYLKVTGRTLCTWRKEGKIPYWKIGARICRYSLSDVERALGKPDVEE
jgi:excisionase family DNA binding protein